MSSTWRSCTRKGEDAGGNVPNWVGQASDPETTGKQTKSRWEKKQGGRKRRSQIHRNTETVCYKPCRAVVDRPHHAWSSSTLRLRPSHGLDLTWWYSMLCNCCAMQCSSDLIMRWRRRLELGSTTFLAGMRKLEMDRWSIFVVEYLIRAKNPQTIHMSDSYLHRVKLGFYFL